MIESAMSLTSRIMIDLPPLALSIRSWRADCGTWRATNVSQSCTRVELPNCRYLESAAQTEHAVVGLVGWETLEG